MSVSIKYKGKTIATARNGQTVELDTKDHKFTDSLFVKSYGGGGSPSINGIIREYKVNAGATVNAGDFVEFVNKWGENNILFDTSNIDVMSACKLNANTVFIAYQYYDGSDNYLYGVVCTIDGTTVSQGTKTRLSRINNSPRGLSSFSAVALTDSKVFIAYQYYVNNSSAAYDMRGLVCTIEGTIISQGTVTSLGINSIRLNCPISIVALTDSKVVVVCTYYNGSTYHLGGLVCTIDGTTISQGTETRLTDDLVSIEASASVAFSDSSVFVISIGSICTYTGATIEDTTITVNTESEGIGTFVQPATSNLHNVGVAATSGSEGETVEVYQAV
jgi:hypothetical protein